MSVPGMRDVQPSFRGGLNTAADESALGQDEARQLANFLLSEHGAAVKRGGSRMLNATTLESGDPIQAGIDFRLAGSNEVLVVVGGKLYTFAPNVPPITMSAETGSLEATGFPHMVQFQNSSFAEVVFIADGGTGLNSWDGSALSADIADTPSGITRLAVYNKRLFGLTGADQKIYWSDLNNGDTLGDVANGGGEAVITTFGDQRTTGFAVVGGSLLIFHVSGISVFSGWTQDDINISAGTSGLTGDVGTIAPRTIVELENEVLFLTERGFYSTNGQSVEPISTNIEDRVSGLTTTQLAASFGVHYRSRREVWFYISGLGFYVFNYRLRSWSGPLDSGFLDPVSTCAWEALNVNGVPVVLVGDDDGFVKQAQYPGTFKDNVLADGTGGTQISAVMQLHRMFCLTSTGPEFESDKAWRWGYVLFDPRNGTDVSVEWSTDHGSGSYDLPLSGAAWGTGVWGTGVWGGAGVLMFRIPMGGRGTFIDVTIRDDSNAAPLYSKFSLEALRIGRRG